MSPQVGIAGSDAQRICGAKAAVVRGHLSGVAPLALLLARFCFYTRLSGRIRQPHR